MRHHLKYSYVTLFITSALVACTSDQPAQTWKTISHINAGLLRYDTPSDRDSLQSYFPGAQIKKSKVDTYGMMLDGFEVSTSTDTTPLFYITFHFNWDTTPPTQESLFAVSTRNADISGPGNARVGTTTVETFRQSLDMTCEFGQNDFRDTYVCLSSDADGYGSNFRALFTAPETYSEPFHQALPDIRDKGVLTEMMYYPRRRKTE